MRIVFIGPLNLMRYSMRAAYSYAFPSDALFREYFTQPDKHMLLGAEVLLLVDTVDHTIRLFKIDIH